MSEPLSRRDFIVAGAAVAAVATSVAKAQQPSNEATTAPAAASPAAATAAGPFKLMYAPHFGLFEKSAGKDIIDQLKFMHDNGFRALEDNGLPKRSVEDQTKIGAELQRLGMTMGVFVAHGNFGIESFVNKSPEIRAALVADMNNAVEVAKRVNAKWATVVLDAVNPKVDMGFQTANAIDNLRYCAEVFEKAGLIMVLEPLNRHNHPNLFLTGVPQAYAICRGVNSPACKILDDLYHQQITEGNLIPNINAAWDEIAYFQTGDNPGRKEPGTGEINYRNVFRHIHNKGFRGVVGMEHGKAVDSVEGEKALIKAYQDADNF